ncbi:MAG: hypothetical protein DRN26_03330 [Thermoplasmata archaeon]|nr:MAG: hypothetical protein DRN26_03330 [Thermoplasmata archaeon]
MRSTRRKVKRRLKRWERRKEDIVHKLSKHIVDVALNFNADIIMEAFTRELQEDTALR